MNSAQQCTVMGPCGMWYLLTNTLLMMGTSCAFLLTKSLDLPLYYFLFFIHMFNYVVIDSEYREVSDYVEGLEMLEDLEML